VLLFFTPLVLFTGEYIMNDVSRLLEELKSCSWKGRDSKKSEIHWLHLHDNHVSTSTMFGKDHPHRVADGLTQEWVDRGDLPQYFDAGSLISGLEKIAKKQTNTCRVVFTHYGGNTDNGPVFGKLHNEFMEIVRLESGEFEIRLLSSGRVREVYVKSV
jgi:hypothetical protein